MSRCAGKDAPVLKIPDVNSYVQVHDGHRPVITLSGAVDSMPYERQLVKGGVKIFTGLTVTATATKIKKPIVKKVAETVAAKTLLKGKPLMKENGKS